MVTQRSLRRRAVLQSDSRQRAAGQRRAADARAAAHAVARARAGGRPAAAVARRRERRRHVHRPLDVPDPDAVRQHPDRSDVLGACEPRLVRRTAAGAPAGRAVRRSAADLGRAAQPQPLRPLRSARRCARLESRWRSARGHARWETRGCCGRCGSGASRSSTGGRRAAASPVADHADAGAAFLGAHAVRSQPRTVGRLRREEPTAVRSISPATAATRRIFKDVGTRLGPIDLALLPIGAYEPRWFMQRIHMNPAEAVQAHLDLDAQQSVGMHFGTFQLTLEGIDEPVMRARGRPTREWRRPTMRFARRTSANRSCWVSVCAFPRGPS